MSLYSKTGPAIDKICDPNYGNAFMGKIERT